MREPALSIHWKPSALKFLSSEVALDVLGPQSEVGLNF